MMDKSEFITLIHKQLTGVISYQESDQLNAWIQNSATNQQLFDEISHTWKISGQSSTDHYFEIKPELEKLFARIDHDTTTGKPYKTSWRTLVNSSVLRYAASLAFLIGLLYSVYYVSNLSQKQGVVQSIATTDSIMQFLLPDSSVVDLNKTSDLKYLDDDNRRTVKFSGEGFFHVKPDSERPFIIHTAYATIQVVGTSFNVRAVENENKTIVTVASGIVKVTSQKLTEVLTVGQQCIVYGDNHNLEKSESIDPNYLAWKTGKMHFENTSLKDVFSQLEKTFGATIKVKEAHLSTCRFTGTFENIKLAHAFEILEFDFGIKVQWNDKLNTAEITGGNCK